MSVFEFSELALMPVRCYGCNKVFFQQRIEKALESGQSLAQVMDNLGYIRICCRSIIMSSPAIVHLMKIIGKEKEVTGLMQRLTLETTSGTAIGPEPPGGAQIIESAPSETQVEICVPQVDESFLDPESQGLNPYEYYAKQLGLTE